MGRRVKVRIDDGPLQWPSECASCGAAEGLREVGAALSENVTGARDAIKGEVRYREVSIRFPACGNHARGARFSAWLTRNSPLPRFVRWFGYLMAPIAILGLYKAIGYWLIILDHWKARGGNDAMPLPFAGQPVAWLMVLGPIALLVLTLLAYRLVPVRLINMVDNNIVVRFASKSYAAAFEALNQDKLAAKSVLRDGW